MGSAIETALGRLDCGRWKEYQVFNVRDFWSSCRWLSSPFFSVLLSSSPPPVSSASSVFSGSAELLIIDIINHLYREVCF